MRPWSDGLKQTLRYLAAARYYLPVELKQGEFPDTERSYEGYLHHTEFELALELLAFLGEENSEDAYQLLFWSELLLAAEHMGLEKHADKYRVRVQQLKDAENPGA